MDVKMDAVNQIIQFIKQLFSWWFIVTPWEQAVFVRLGKRIRVLHGGFYFKVPFIDQVYVQSIRLRAIDMPIQTISSKDGSTITIKSVMNYAISDIYKLYNTISHPDTTLSAIVMSKIAEYIMNHNKDDIDTQQLEKDVINELHSVDYGLNKISFKITSWAEVKTIRLIQDQSWSFEGMDLKTTVK